ncbi:hypothetical protein CDAR_438371 [Caerostris darwini]|uniref:Uncharacterized protein n=1 Tax=Caerostris darwini TaxID=1538125 RepID=A0AAV4X0V1_9ARAC|nr:hypothetical protein CDAR_438371 [Caerostris darwini]
MEVRIDHLRYKTSTNSRSGVGTVMSPAIAIGQQFKKSSPLARGFSESGPHNSRVVYLVWTTALKMTPRLYSQQKKRCPLLL